MGWMVQQYMPKVELPKFDGSALNWVDFITKFHDVVHQQEYLTDRQKNQMLFQHLQGEAKMAVRGFANDPDGYVRALQRLKYMFGQRFTVAQAVLSKVTKGKAAQENDLKSLSELFYSITECLVTLRQLNYSSDLYSSETLRQAVSRLPQKLQLRWAENSINIRSREEPNLLHLHKWLELRLLALKEARLPKVGKKPADPSEPRSEYTAVTGVVVLECQLCGSGHQLWNCEQYKSLTSGKKIEVARKSKTCFNCLQRGHLVKDCTSRNTCCETGCSEKHHSSLHQYFAEKASASAKKKDDQAKNDGQANKVAAVMDKQQKTDDQGKKDDQAGKDKQVKKEDPVKDGPLKGNDQSNGKNSATNATMVTASKIGQHREVILQIVPVRIHGKDDNFVDTHAILDSCSQSTLIREDIAERLKLPGECRNINLTTVDSVKQVKRKEVTFDISSRCGGYRTTIECAQSTPVTNFNMPDRPSLREVCDVDAFTHLDGIDLDAVPASDVTILIGADSPESVLTSEVRRGEKGQPLAVETKFGWTLFGPTLGTDGQTRVADDDSIKAVGDSLQSFWTDRRPSVKVNLIHSRSDESLHHQVEAFWKQENCGILSPKDVALSREDKAAWKEMEGKTRWDGRKYEVPMLWISPTTTLPNNYPLARKRWNFLWRKLRSKPEVHAGMNKVIMGYLEADPPQARKMTKVEASTTSDRTNYLPIHPVENVHKPGSGRIPGDQLEQEFGDRPGFAE